MSHGLRGESQLRGAQQGNNKVITKQKKIQETGFFWIQTPVEKVKPTRVQQKKLSYFLLPVPKVFKATNQSTQQQ